MARWFGFSFERIPYSTDKLEEYLSKLGVMYLLPFGDLSAYPTFLLAKGIIDRHQDYGVVLDGTGADGAFGLLGNATWWRRVSRLPRFAGKLGGFVYKAGKMWMRPDSRIGRLLRILYSSAQMPSVHASIAQNPLYEIAYHVPDFLRSETQELLAEWLEACVPWTRDLSPQRFSTLDLVLVCCGIFAQKDKAIFDASPIEVRYPFLEPNIVRLALERAVYWPGAEQPKSPLKNLLAQHVPREMVFRPKSAFNPPIKELLQSAAFLKAVDHMLESTGSISSILDRDCISSLHRCLEQGQDLPVETYNLIWTAVFASLWLDQICQGKSD
jgi:asparagine synthetase B (glutamine-hydrolysing)